MVFRRSFTRIQAVRRISIVGFTLQRALKSARKYRRIPTPDPCSRGMRSSRVSRGGKKREWDSFDLRSRLKGGEKLEGDTIEEKELCGGKRRGGLVKEGKEEEEEEEKAEI
ncbi:hypothetical protein M0804_007156 [Polistes exclamans]|nr:hypothetical protein M0804_007156 [Polistes exclamans]